MIFVWCWMVCVFPVNAQLIDNSEGISLLESTKFNPVFVRSNKIATIKGVHSVKRESDIIRTAAEHEVYHFDRVGRLVQVEKIRNPGKGNTEITSTYYRFDTDGTLIDKVIADVQGATSYGFKYDESGRVISETCSRMESPRDTLSQVGPKRSEIYTEEFRYTELDNGYKRVTLNSYQRPYKEEFFYFDEHGYLVEERHRYLMNNRMGKKTYQYNERGLLEQKSVINNLAEPDTIQFNYSYDDAGNLLAAHELKNSTQVRRIEFLYDPASWLLNARLAKNEETELIRIVKYETEFFD